MPKISRRELVVKRDEDGIPCGVFFDYACNPKELFEGADAEDCRPYDVVTRWVKILYDESVYPISFLIPRYQIGDHVIRILPANMAPYFLYTTDVIQAELDDYIKEEAPKNEKTTDEPKAQQQSNEERRETLNREAESETLSDTAGTGVTGKADDSDAEEKETQRAPGQTARRSGVDGHTAYQWHCWWNVFRKHMAGMLVRFFRAGKDPDAAAPESDNILQYMRSTYPDYWLRRVLTIVYDMNCLAAFNPQAVA